MDATLPSPVKAALPSFNWHQLPEPVTHRCCESSRMRQATTRAFAVLTLATAAATVYTALYFTALPFTVITVVSGLAALTTALAITTVLVSRMKALPTDPEVLLQKRVALGDALEQNSDLGFEEMQQICPSLKAFSKEELNLLVRNDAQTMEYTAFMNKHGDRVLHFLDDENLKALRPKWLHHVMGTMTKTYTLDQILALGPSKKFDINQDDLNLLLTYDVIALSSVDISGLTYADFIAKYGTNVLTIVALGNKTALQESFYIHLRQSLPLTEDSEDMQGYSLEKLQQMPEWKAFGLDKELINELLESDINSNPSYVEFVKKYGTNVVLTILQDENLYCLRPSFMQFLVETYIHDQKLGLKDLMSKPEVKLFQVEEHEVKVLIANKQIQLLMQEKKGFADFEFALIEAITDTAGKAYILEKYKEHILGLKCGLIHYKTFKYEHAAFGPAVTQELYDAILSREFAAFEHGELTYLSLRERNGLGVLREHLMSDKNVELQTKARLSFLTLSYELISKYVDDHKVLGLTPPVLKDALKLRWESKSFTDAKFPDHHGFFASMGPGKEFSPRDWTKKVLEDTKDWSIHDIATTFSSLFTEQVLISTDCIEEGQATIRQRVEKEMENMATFEQFFNHFPYTILECHLIDGTSQMLSALVKKFVLEHPDLYLKGPEDKYVKAIAKYKLMPAALSKHVEKMRHGQICETTRYNTCMGNLDQLLKDQVAEAEKARDATIAQAQKEANIPGKEAEVQQITSQKSTAEKEVKSLEAERLACEAKKLSLGNLSELSDKVSALDKEQKDLAALKLDERIPPLQLKIAQTKNLISLGEKQVESNAEFLQMRSELSALKDELGRLNAKANELGIIAKKQKQRIALESQRDLLAKTVHSPEFVQQKTQHYQAINAPITGMLNAISAATSSSTHKAALAQLEAKEKQLAKLEQDIAQLPQGDVSAEMDQILSKTADLSAKEGLKQAVIKVAQQKSMKGIEPLKANLQGLQSNLSSLQAQKARMDACGKEFVKTREALHNLQQEMDQLNRKTAGLSTKLNVARQSVLFYFSKYHDARENLDETLTKLTQDKRQAQQAFLQSTEELEKTHQQKRGTALFEFNGILDSLKDRFVKLAPA